MHFFLLIANFPGFGGIERVTQVLAEGMVSAGHAATIVSLRPTHVGATTASLDTRVAHNVLPCASYPDAPENSAYFVHLLREHQPTAVLYQDGYTPDLLPLLQRVYAQQPFRLFVAEHNTPLCHVRAWGEVVRGLNWCSPKDWLRAMAWPFIRAKRWPQVVARHKALVAMAEGYVVLSEAYIPHLLRLVGEEYRHKVSYQGNPLTLPLPTDQKAIVGQKEKECLVVARLERDKGIDLLMRIWPRFAEQHLDWRLTILGVGPMEATLCAAIAAGRMPRTRLATPTHDVAPYYARASCLLLTSRFEGWGLVLTEAMAYGCLPIAFHSYAALPSIYTDGVEGYIVPAFNVSAFVAAMDRLVRLPDHMAMQQAAMARAATFAVPEAVAQWQARMA